MGNDLQMITQCPATHEFSSSVLVSICIYHRIVWKNSLTYQNSSLKMKRSRVTSCHDAYAKYWTIGRTLLTPATASSIIYASVHILRC